MFQKILCPIDGSDHATKAFGLAMDLAQKYDAELLIMHVLNRQENIDSLQHFAEVEGLTQGVNTELQRFNAMDYRVGMIPGSALQDTGISPRLLVDIGQYLLDGAKARAEREGINTVDVRLEDGNPASRILNCIKKENVDCVVLGSRGLSDIKGLVQGSVSHKISSQADCTCISVK